MPTTPAAEAAPTSTGAAASSRIPALDGLRGVAIALVIVSHLSGSLGYARELMAVAGPVGHLGVRIFLIMTGFLVTHLLLREWDRTGGINLRRFWTRRVFRLLPVALLFLVAVYGAAALGRIQLRWPQDVLYPLTFTMNYYSRRGWYWVHLWSLSAQMQFYLLWPLLLLAVGRARVLPLTLAVLLITPVVRLVTFNVFPVWYTQGHAFETIFDIFATGSLLALWRNQLGESKAYQHFIRSPAILGVVLVLFAMQHLFVFAKPRLVLGTVLNAAIAVLIDRSTRVTDDWWGRFLAWRPVVFLGMISYSLYVWQQPFVNIGTPLHFPFSLLLAMMAGTAVYYLVERPLTAYGRETSA